MKKKINVSELKLGMYVSELDRPWTSTKFLFQGFEIADEETLQALRNTCEYVYIDTEKTVVITRKQKVHDDVTITAVDESTTPTKANLNLVTRGPSKDIPKKRWVPQSTSLEEELPQARRVETEMRDLLHNVLEEVRLGHTINSESTKTAVAEMVESIIRNPDAMGVLSQLKNADDYTALHSERVCILALTFGRHLDMGREELNLLGIGALLHDVGKMRVPEEILNKKGRLTEDEFEIMKKHVTLGVEILENTPGIPRRAIELVAHHHERYGGGGYVSGIKGDAIGLFGMIAGIIDCFDAITSDRAYHTGMTSYEALSKLYQWRNTAFHPRLVEQFIQCMGVYPIGSVVELTNGAIGVVATVNRERRLKPRVVLVLNSNKQPFTEAKTIDLMSEATINPKGAPDIKKVIPAGEYGISPTDYLPNLDMRSVSNG